MSRTKHIADFPKPYRDALAYWSTFRNLGFDAAEIFFGFGEVSRQPDWIHLQIQTQGKDFTACVAQLPGADVWQVQNTWKKLCKVVHRSTEPERTACIKDHMLGNLDYFAALVQAIQAKGIVIPQLPHLAQHAGDA